MKGSLLAVFGPDGSGKSTVVKNLVRYYKSHARDVVTLHWRPGLLPYKLRSHPGSVSFTDPHGHHIRRGLKGLMILFYIFVDFLLGHIFVVLPAKRKGKIVMKFPPFFGPQVKVKNATIKLSKNEEDFYEQKTKSAF